MAKYKPRRRVKPKELLVFVVFALLFLFVKLIYELYGNSIYSFVVTTSKRVGAGNFGVKLIGIVCIAIVGYGLYLVRERWRVTYGLVEIAFALTYGWHAISKVTEVGYVESISIIAAVYLVVRGVDNVMTGRRLVSKTVRLEESPITT